MLKTAKKIPIATLSWFIIFLGGIFRSLQYISNRSLWLDEAIIVSRLSEYSLTQLTNGFIPEASRSYPIGFLFIEQWLLQNISNHEMILRLFPFICSILSLILFKILVDKTLSPPINLIALTIFAVSHDLIYYASEIKPYSCDVFFSLALSLAFLRIYQKPLSTFNALGFGIIGGIACLFSFPSIFVLLAASIFLCTHALIHKKKQMLVNIILSVMVWGFCFYVYYSLSLNALSVDPRLFNYWQNSFFTLSLNGLKLLVQSFENPCGLFMPELAFFLCLLGVYKIIQDKRGEVALLIMPIALTLLISAFKIYPFADRLILFLMPAYCILIAHGFTYFTSIGSQRKLVISAGLIILLIHPVVKSAYHAFKPIKNEELRPVLLKLKEHFQPQDQLYIYASAQHAYRYYAPKLDFAPQQAYLGISSRDNKEKLLKDVNQFRGNARVWFLFSHVHEDEKSLLLYFLNLIGQQNYAIEDVGSSAFLYNLN